MSSDSSSSSSSSSTSTSISVDSSAPITSDQQKHPLQNGWTMYYNTGTSGNWVPKELSSFDTVEDMWRLLNNVPPPSRTPAGSMYYLFKDSVKPEWEDPANKEGGRWILSVKVAQTAGAEAVSAMDDTWLYTVLALCGEQFEEDNDDICGCVAKPRGRELYIELWHKSGDDMEKIMRIGKLLKLNAEFQQTIQYKPHPRSGDDPKQAKKILL